MASFSKTITAGTDDGIWTEGNSYFSSTTNIYAGGYFDGIYQKLNTFLRFTGITLPPGSVITAAKITLKANETKSTSTVNAKISAIDEDSASAPNTYNDAENAVRTSAYTNWDAIGAWTNGLYYDTPDISSVIQEVIDRGGWVSGNAIVVYIEDNVSTTSTSNYRRAESYDLDSLGAAVLEITYEAESKPVTPILNTSNSLSQSLILAWLFNEGTGTAISDYSGENNNGTVIGGGTWETGTYGAELALDGTNDRVKNDSLYALGTGERSIMIVLNNRTVAATVNVLAAIGLNAPRFGFYAYSTNLYFWNADPGGDTLIKNGTWTTGYHVLIATKPATAGGGKAYVDNATPIALNTYVGSTTEDFYVGVNDIDVANDWHPEIDIVAAMIWDRELTLAEVTELQSDPFVHFRAVASLPIVTTGTATSITYQSAVLNGEVTSTGGLSTTRGFELGTVAEMADKTITTSTSELTGGYDNTATGLTSSTTYYYRAYASNAEGTGYGSWESFTTAPATYNVIIGGIDRTDDVVNQSPVIEDVLNDQQNTCSLALIDRSGSGIPATDDAISITLDSGTKIFSGYVQKIDLSKQQNGVILAILQCIDEVWLLDRNLVHKTYTDMTDKAIIENIVSTYCAGLGITTANVIEGVTINQITFNYIQPSQAIRKICDLTGRNWYIDYFKDIHYFPLLTNTAPYDIDADNNDYTGLKISKDNTQLRNRIYVRGGTKLSDTTTYSTKGDGSKRVFVLPDKPHDLTLTVNGSPQTIGIKNIHSSGFDWYLNFQEKYIEQDAAGVVLASTDTLSLTYKYDIPILVALDDPASILEDGEREFAIFDKSITTTQAARDRASAELTDYAQDIVEGSFSTYTPGFVSGQYIHINLPEYGVNSDYIVNKVIARSLGGGLYEYDITLTSAKTLGIIRFLIELLEANKNLIELDDNESVDELFSLTDSLITDSILDSLIIDSAGPYRTWCSDSLDATSTRARFELFEWGGNA